MMEYGIRIYEKDNTPGYKSSDTWEKWYETKEDRDEKYEAFSRPISLRWKELCYPDNPVERTYTKIERLKSSVKISSN